MKDAVKHILEILYMWFPLFALIAIWEYTGSSGILNPSIMPAPSGIIETFVNMLESGRWQTNLLASLGRIVKGFFVGSSCGLVVGILMGSLKPIEKFMTILVGFFRPIPTIAWIPLFILWLGIGDVSKVTIISIGCFWSVLLNTLNGMKNVDKKLLEVAILFEKSWFTQFYKIILPSALPSILTGLRLAVSSALMGVLAAEMLAANSGIGFLITFGRDLAQPGIMLVGVLTIAFLGLIVDFILLKVEKRLLRWNTVNDKSK
ncbi:MAG: ABC transporter permease [Ruminiclostridium sp.]